LTDKEGKKVFTSQVDRWKRPLTVLGVILAAGGGFFVFLRGPNRVSEKMQRVELCSACNATQQYADGPQLVSSEPLPEMDGEMCAMPNVSSQKLLLASFKSQENSRSADPANPKNEQDIDETPIRVIRDSYATYSAVAVDPKRSEIILQDENLFNILVYDRLVYTSPRARETETERQIGGVNTKVQFNCALYVDPQNGDIYSVANDTMNEMVVFSRDQHGNVAPRRELSTPHRAYGIAVDEANREMFLTVENPNEVVVYSKTASRVDKPLRVLRGPHTHLGDAHGIAIDTQNNLMYVTNHGSVEDDDVPGSGRFEPPSITVYPLKANGDVAPLRVIRGPQTQLNWPAHIALDSEHQELFVANDGTNSVLVFRAADSGNAAPIRAIHGSKTNLLHPTGVALDTVNQEIVVANMGNHRATVYPRTANGNVAPIRTIRSSPPGKLALAIGNPGAVGYDNKRQEILVPN
jgi:DNA-binding beta-propeller fold protein YncE